MKVSLKGLPNTLREVAWPPSACVVRTLVISYFGYQTNLVKILFAAIFFNIYKKVNTHHEFT